jgi:hypothetical protein
MALQSIVRHFNMTFELIKINSCTDNIEHNKKNCKVILTLGPPFTPTPYFNLKHCYLQSENFIESRWNLVPQYLMYKL